MRHTKTINQRFHAKRRARERFGLELNRQDLREIAGQIQNGKDARLLGQESLRLSHWMVSYQGTEMHAVYDKKRHQVVTFLPVGATFRQA